MLGSTVSYLAFGAGAPTVPPSIPSDGWALYQDTGTGLFYVWNAHTTAWVGASSSTDPNAVHLSPGGAESGDIVLATSGSGDISCDGLILSGAWAIGGNSSIQQTLTVRRIIAGTTHGLVTFLVNDAGAAGTGALLVADSGTFPSGLLYPKMALTAGVGCTAGKMGEVNWPFTALTADSINADFFGLDAASAALLPFGKDTGDDSGTELWLGLPPTFGVTYHFGCICFGA